MLSLLGAWVRSLVGELRSCTLCGAAKRKKKKKRHAKGIYEAVHMTSARVVQAGSGKPEVVLVQGESSMNLAGSWLQGRVWGEQEVDWGGRRDFAQASSVVV